MRLLKLLKPEILLNAMLALEQTRLETFNFGNEINDTFYVLVNALHNPNGIALSKLAMANPARFDAALNEMGCLLMLTGEEVQELVNRGELDYDSLHQSIFEIAKREGMLN